MATEAMTELKVDEIKRIFREDATGQGTLYKLERGVPVYCALGGLAKSAGATDKELLSSSGKYGSDYDEALYPFLSQVYGLTPDECDQIYETNDDIFDLEERRNALYYLIDSFVEERSS